jgi:glycolate oxidase FAD binding subunit
VSETRDVLERELGARGVGTAVVDDREVPVAFPANEAVVVELLRIAAERSWRVLPIGSGTKLERGVPREKPKFAISVRGLSGVTAYERGDGTLTARAGSTMAALAEVARAGGNHLTPDVAHAKHATLGGTIAAGASGVDRLRYGPVRNHVLGLRVALADGTIVKSGGRLVKNVTGFDVHRLYTGSRGSLCVVLEASLRLFPLPEQEVVLEAEYFGRDAALAAARTLLAAVHRPVCVGVSGPEDGRWKLVVGLAGRRDVLASETERALALIGDARRFTELEARAQLEALRDRDADATLRVSLLPGEVDTALAALDTLAPGAPCVIHPGVAMLTASVGAAQITATARAVAACGAAVEIANVPLAARASFDPLEQVPAPARALMSRLKHALDPNARFASARAVEVASRG